MVSSMQNVSRETMDKLRAYSALVLKWTPKINLISKSSEAEIWNRHIVDSAQIFDVAPRRGHWVDLGSGGGLPGIVISILSQGAKTDHRVTLVESDQRKSIFLRTALRELSLKGTVVSKRIEEIPSLGADVLSARALMDLSGLLGFTDRHLNPNGVAIFPKGVGWKKEDQIARTKWSYDCEPIKSVTQEAAAVLRIKDISRV